MIFRNKKGISSDVLWTISRLLIPIIVFLALLAMTSRNLSEDPYKVQWKVQELRLVTELMQSAQSPFITIFPNRGDTTSIKEGAIEFTPESKDKKSPAPIKLSFLKSDYTTQNEHTTKEYLTYQKLGDQLTISSKLPTADEFANSRCYTTKKPEQLKNPRILILSSNSEADKTTADQLTNLLSKTGLEIIKTQDQKPDILISIQCSAELTKTIIIPSPKHWPFACIIKKEFPGFTIQQDNLEIFNNPPANTIQISYQCKEPIDPTNIFAAIQQLTNN